MHKNIFVSFFCKLLGPEKSLHFGFVSFVSFSILGAQKRYEPWVSKNKCRDQYLCRISRRKRISTLFSHLTSPSCLKSRLKNLTPKSRWEFLEIAGIVVVHDGLSFVFMSHCCKLIFDQPHIILQHPGLHNRRFENPTKSSFGENFYWFWIVSAWFWWRIVVGELQMN